MPTLMLIEDKNEVNKKKATELMFNVLIAYCKGVGVGGGGGVERINQLTDS